MKENAKAPLALRLGFLGAFALSDYGAVAVASGRFLGSNERSYSRM
jgi:hypothetical protein